MSAPPKPPSLLALQYCQDYLATNAYRFAVEISSDNSFRLLAQAMFLMTFEQEFLLNVRVDGTGSIDDIEYSKTPAFTFERLRRREFRDIVMNVSRLAKRNKICPDGYHYAAQFLTKNMFLNLSSNSSNKSEENQLSTPPNSEINSQENLLPSEPNSNLQFSTVIPHKTRKAELLMAPMVQFLDSIFRLESDRSSTKYLTGELKHLPNILLYVIPEDVSDLIEDPDLNKPMKPQGSESCLQKLTKGTKKVKGPMSLAQIATDPAAATNIQPFPQQQGYKVLRTASSDRTNNLQANNGHSSAKYSDFLFLYSKKKSQSESVVHQISQVPPGGKDVGHTMPNSESSLDVAGNKCVFGNTSNNKHSLQARRSTRTASDICSESMRTPNQRRVGSHSKQDSAAAHQYPVLQTQEPTARSTYSLQDKQSWTADSQRSGRLLPSNSLPKPPEHSQPSWLIDPTQPNSHRRPTDLEIPMAMYSYGQYASDSFIRRPLVHPAYGIPGYSGNYWFPGYAGFYHPYMNLGTCQSPPNNIQLNVHLANSASKEAGATCPPPLLGKKEKGKAKH